MTIENDNVHAREQNRIHVAAFAGSLRRHSLNRGLIRAAVDVAPPQMQITQLALDGLPLFNADIDGVDAPKAVREFRRQIAEADALLIASPEYNYSITGVLKNAIDWASRGVGGEVAALQGQPAAIMGAGGRFGTVRSQAHLRHVLLHNDIKVLNKPELMLARARDSFDQEANLIDAGIRERLQELVQALYDWTLLLRSAA